MIEWRDNGHPCKGDCNSMNNYLLKYYIRELKNLALNIKAIVFRVETFKIVFL